MKYIPQTTSTPVWHMPRDALCKLLHTFLISDVHGLPATTSSVDSANANQYKIIENNLRKRYLHFRMFQNHLESLINTLLGLIPGVSDPVVLEWSPRICYSNKAPNNADATGLRIIL